MAINTKKGENKNKGPQKDINSHSTRTKHKEQLKTCRKLTCLTRNRNGKDGIGHLWAALIISGQWDITIEPGEHRTMMQEICFTAETTRKELKDRDVNVNFIDQFQPP